MKRIVCWYSSGIASAVATKLMIDDGYDVVIVKTETNSEHPDNARFDAKCEELFGRPIMYLHNDKYDDTWDVFQKTKYLVGPKGARCTTELKKKVRQAFQQDGDLQVFGYTADEEDRAKALIHNNPEINIKCPLIERGWSKAMCFDYFNQFGIKRPEMYSLGFNNNNCIGCVKGGIGYWNRIRQKFPDVFDRMAKLEREIGIACCKTWKGNFDEEGNKLYEPIFLDELPPNKGVHRAMYLDDLFSHSMNCDFLCGGQ